MGFQKNAQFYLEFCFFLRDEEGSTNTSFFYRKQICNWEISDSLNVKYQMGLIWRLRHLNLGAVCDVWSSSVYVQLSCLHISIQGFGNISCPPDTDLEMWVSCWSCRCLRYPRAFHLALHAHIWSAFLPVWGRKRKRYFACMLLHDDDWNKTWRKT